MSIKKKKRNFIIHKHFIPSDLNLQGIIEANPPKFVYNLDFLNHLIHLTIAIPARKWDLLGRNGFVPFNAHILQSKNRQYADHLKYLVENGVLDEDRQYSVGIKSRSYRIAEKYLSEKLEEIEITDEKLLKGLNRAQKVDFHATIKYKNLYQWFNSDITVDVDSAMDYCMKELEQQRNIDYYNAYSHAYIKIVKIKMLAGGHFWFHQDKFGRRLHTNFTNLDKDLKQFITYAGEPLVSIDLKNSQPFISLKLLKNKLQSPEHTVLENTPQILDFTDVLTYAKLVSNGKFYNYMVEQMEIKFGRDYFTKEYRFDSAKQLVVKNDLEPRDRVKLETFQIFFSKNETNSKLKELFRQLFPNVMQVFEQFKGNKFIVAQDRHKRLAKELQRTESRLMLDKIAPELNRMKHDMPIFTIHDSIVTTVGHEYFVAEVMANILEEETGFTPELEPEYWRREDNIEERVAA